MSLYNMSYAQFEWIWSDKDCSYIPQVRNVMSSCPLARTRIFVTQKNYAGYGILWNYGVNRDYWEIGV